MTYKTYLPIFSGFYNTVWEPQEDDLLYSLNQERKENGLQSIIEYDDLEIDYQGYESDVVFNLCEVIQKRLNKYINHIEFENIYSPKEYNFRNDSANVIIDVNEKEISSFIYANKEKFSEFLKNRYTSCDGFMSHYDNDFKSWEDETKNFMDFSIDGHRLGSILDFIAIMEDVTEEMASYYCRCYENNVFERFIIE